jgi:cell division protease FtsH
LPDGVGASARRFSPQTGREIDCAVRALTEAALRSAREILSQHRALLERGSQELLALETLSEDQVRALLEMPAKPLNTPSAG